MVPVEPLHAFSLMIAVSPSTDARRINIIHTITEAVKFSVTLRDTVSISEGKLWEKVCKISTRLQTFSGKKVQLYLCFLPSR